MSYQSLLETGKVALAEIRRQEVDAKAKAEELESERRVQAWAKVLEPLYAVLPAELHGHVDYDSTEMPTWRGFSGRVWLDVVPGCRIGVGDNSGTLRFYPQTASRVVTNHYCDPKEFYVEYEHAVYDGYIDPLVAIAHAAELAPANLAMEADAKAQGEAAVPKEKIAKRKPSDQERIANLIDDGNHIEAIARTLLWIAVSLENR